MFASEKLLNRNFRRLMTYYTQRAAIAYPNIYVKSNSKPNGRFSATYHLERIKDIDGVSVPYAPLNATANLFDTHIDVTGDTVDYQSFRDLATNTFYSNQSKDRNPAFFNVKADWKKEFSGKPSQELALTKEMDGQLVEVALTFDKPYSYQDLQEMLPENLKQNWFWMGTINPEQNFAYDLADVYGLSFRQKELEMNYTYFIQQVAEAMKDPRHKITTFYGGSDTTFSNYDDLEYIKKNYPTLETAKFSGVILTGKAENFAQLEGKDWIFASSIGTSIPNQPYYHLEKE